MDAVIGLGANLGDRRATLVLATQKLSGLGETRQRSALYETEPVGPPQPMFLNAAIALRTALEPLALLDGLLELERALGRVRSERWGPRVIDLDILWIDGRSFESPRLKVPHPELRHRAFALRPLLDVAPLARDPRDGARYADVLAELTTPVPLEIAGTRNAWA
jgi:2-amino-4-hydroxy-6-hydroxymethyldihydropteridine diphosphokinase